MRTSALALSILALAAASCGTSTDTTYTCVSVAPDADAGASDLLCNVAWSCNNDTTHYGLQCRFVDGNYACSCMVEGASVKSFAVAHFPCDPPENALPAVTTACGWTIELQ